MKRNPFHTAEEYIRLRTKCNSPSWLDTVMRVNEMFLAPIVTCFLVLCGETDLFGIISSAMTVYSVWSEWTRYTHLAFEMQNMLLMTMLHGGPKIVTNDPDYMPYVYADAVFRLYERRLRPLELRRP
jgi:hypothetical protein